jgi:hypothetical protein
MIECPKCKSALNENIINSPVLTRCSGCGVHLRADVFPAAYRRTENGKPSESLKNTKEAGCFYHPDKRAVIHCSMCGRFLCALCDLEFGERNLCPACLEIGNKKQQLENLANDRILYDNIALFLSVIPFTFILWFLSFITAPAALFVVIRYWKAPSSLLPRSKVRFVVAFILAGLQIAGWSVLFYSIAA